MGPFVTFHTKIGEIVRSELECLKIRKSTKQGLNYILGIFFLYWRKLVFLFFAKLTTKMEKSHAWQKLLYLSLRKKVGQFHQIGCWKSAKRQEILENVINISVCLLFLLEKGQIRKNDLFFNFLLDCWFANELL